MSKNNKAICPNCGRLSEKEYRPFCSRRCRDIDLSRWIKGEYAIPVVEENGAESED